MEIYDYAPIATNNDGAPPNGAPEFMQYSEVNDTIREVMASIARWRDAAFSAAITTGGTGAAFTLTTGQGLAAYVNGQRFSFTAHAAPSTSPFTLNVDGLGASNVIGPNGAALPAGAWAIGSRVEVVVTGSAFQMLTPLSASLVGPAVSVVGNLPTFANTGGSLLADSGIPANAVGFQTRVDIASAATTDLGTLPGHFASILGTTNISSFGSSANAARPIYLARFNGTLTLVHSSPGLAIPGARNLVVNQGDTVLLEYFGSGFWGVIAHFPGVGPLAGAAVVNGLTWRNNLANPNTQIDVVTSLSSVITDANGGLIRVPGTAATINAATVGLNGLDTGALAANTWYYLWLISNGVTPGYLLSASSTSPTLPAGYTCRYRIGAILTNGSSQLTRVVQKGNTARYEVIAGSTTPNLPIIRNANHGSAIIPTWAANTISTWFAPTAARIQGTAYALAADLIIAPNNAYGAINSATNPPPVTLLTGGGTSSCALFDFVVESASFYSASLATTRAIIAAMGWTDSVNAN